MSVYAIADLHLSTSDKTKLMDVFGGRWIDYTNKIKDGWMSTVTDEDTVILAGDFSWGMTLDNAFSDFSLINSLPGKKIMIEGNHDFWWSSLKKMTDFCKTNGFDFSFLRCDSYNLGNFALCGSRGWYSGEKGIGNESTDNTAVVAREALRLEMSILHAKKNFPDLPYIVFTHFPPVYGSYVCEPIMQILQKYEVKKCYFGHIHGVYDSPTSFTFRNIEFNLISADTLNFKPCEIIC